MKMLCRKCPHVVKHGKMLKSGEIEFSHGCGLAMRKANNPDVPAKDKPKGPELNCDHFPFESDFDYLRCPTYVKTFCATDHKNDVVVSGEISINMGTTACSDMNLL